MFALLDGNNFYASCERAFKPDLYARPVVILSNNDGCAIARSEEAKALGIKMGAPYFQIQALEKSAGLIALSANFALYGDMSDRMMSLAAGLGHRQEVYSIDECFIDLSGMTGDLALRARKIRGRIGRWLGLPTCVGIGPTKTLAKLANHIAKSAERKPGSYPAQWAQVCQWPALTSPAHVDLLKATPIGAVWGVGPRLAQQLQHWGMQTAHELAQADPGAIQRRWSIVLAKTVRELNGTACLGLDDMPPPRQQIAHTRSFGQAVTRLEDLLEAITEFACKAATKLRKHGLQAGQVMVFIRTSPFRPHDRQHSACLGLPLTVPSDDSLHIATIARAMARQMHQQGHPYAKAGVILLDLRARRLEQFQLEGGASASRQRLMAALDSINHRYGQHTLRLASTGDARKSRPWEMKQERLTSRYTTDWQGLAVARG